MALGVLTRSKKRRMEEEESLADRISSISDGVLGDIVSLLPTRAGARAQVLSSRWRHIWRSAPLNLDGTLADCDIRLIISSHPGPGRRFSYNSYGNVDHFLVCTVLEKLQELEVHHVIIRVPESVHRFSSTLRIATFSSCSFPDGNNASATLHLPLLKQLSLVEIWISESSLRELLAACPVLQSLLLRYNTGLPAAQIVLPSLISISVHSGWGCHKLQQLVIKDAPCLERFLFFGGTNKVNVLVISAPKLHILGELCDNCFPRFQSSTAVVQGSNIASMPAVVSSVKLLALSNVKLSLDVVINIIKCFPHLEKLYIQIRSVGVKHWSRYRKIIGTLDIRLRKIVLANYMSYKSHVNLAKFFLSNASVLELMRFELPLPHLSDECIEEELSLLQIENRASMFARFEFVSENILSDSCSKYADVHDLSIPDPFQRISQSVGLMTQTRHI